MITFLPVSLVNELIGSAIKCFFQSLTLFKNKDNNKNTLIKINVFF
jgi:hypothetical protein